MSFNIFKTNSVEGDKISIVHARRAAFIRLEYNQKKIENNGFFQISLYFCIVEKLRKIRVIPF